MKNRVDYYSVFLLQIFHIFFKILETLLRFCYFYITKGIFSTFDNEWRYDYEKGTEKYRSRGNGRR